MEHENAYEHRPASRGVANTALGLGIGGRGPWWWRWRYPWQQMCRGWRYTQRGRHGGRDRGAEDREKAFGE